MKYDPGFCYPRGGITASVVSAPRQIILSAWRFALGLREEFFGFDLVAAAVDGGNEVVFAEEIDEHGEVFVIHDDNRAVIVGHELELHFVGVVDELVLGHFFADVERLELLHERFLILEQGIQGEPLGEREFVFVGQLFGLGVGDDLGFVIVLEEILEFLLVEDYDRIVDNGDLVVIRHLERDFGGERLETLAVEFPARATFECGAGGNGFGDIESLGLSVVAGVSEAGDDAFDFLKFIEMVAHGVDVAGFVFDKMDERLGATDVAEEGAVDDFVFTVGFFVFAAFETFVSFFDNVAGSLLHEEGFDAGGELVGVTDAVRSVIFVEEEELDGDIVLYFVDLVGPVEDIKIAGRAGGGGGSRSGSATRSLRGMLVKLIVLIFHKIYLTFGLL